MAKTLVHKTNKTETLVIQGELDASFIITGENGDRINLEERLLDFVGQDVVISLRTKDEEKIEVIE